MKKTNNYIILGILATTFFACKNRDINEGEAFRPREIHDNYAQSHFTKVEVDGIEYLMMERDNNNPHEGFGFMAFRANKLIAKTDSSLVYLKSINEMQARIYARLYNVSLDEARTVNQEIFGGFMKEMEVELNELKNETYMVVDITQKPSPEEEDED